MRLYREAAGAARQPAARAAATNGLARALAKSGQTAQAVSQYELLLERDGNLRDEDGMAYARYALHQLALLRADDGTHVVPPLLALLSRLESGQDALTDQTEPLLQDIESWLKRNPEVTAANERIPREIQVLRSRLEFVARDARNINFFQSDDPASFPVLELGSLRGHRGRGRGRPETLSCPPDGRRA